MVPRLLALESIGEPVETVEETVSGSGTSGDDVPLAVAEGLQTELLSDVRNSHRVGEILLVGQDENDGFAELILAQQLLQLQSGLIDTLAIVGIDDVDDTLSVEVVVAPQGTDLVLSSNIPVRSRNREIGVSSHEHMGNWPFRFWKSQSRQLGDVPHCEVDILVLHVEFASSRRERQQELSVLGQMA